MSSKMGIMRTAVAVLALAAVCLGARKLLGGWNEVAPNARHLELAHFAVASQTEGLEYYNTVVEVTKASQQVVAGMNYRLTLKVVPSTCKVAEDEYSKERCLPQPNAAVRECVAKIYDIPWKHEREVTSFRCTVN